MSTIKNLSTPNLKVSALSANRAELIPVLIALGLIAVAIWPIYQTPWYLLTVISAVAVAALAYWFVRKFSDQLFPLLAFLLVSYLVLVVFLAYPAVYRDWGGFAQNWADAVISGLSGWKALLTVSAPVGDYFGLLVPVFVLFLFGSALVFYFANKSGAEHFWAVAVLLAMQLFPFVFGTGQLHGSASLFGLHWYGITELVITVLAFTSVFVWLVLRKARLQREALATNAVLRKFGTSRLVIASGMILMAVLIAAVLTPLTLAGKPRGVLRTVTNPQLLNTLLSSPLSDFRSFQTVNYHQELFSYQLLAGEVPKRIKIAVLSNYNGTSFNALDPSNPQSTALVRVPGRTAAAANSTSAAAELQISLSDSWDLPWVPLPTMISQIEFLAYNQRDLAEKFYYQPENHYGINLSQSWKTGAIDYWVKVEPGAELANFQELAAPAGQAQISAEVLPDSLIEWIRSQELGNDSSSLELLVKRLLSRGYLSHSAAETLAGESGSSLLQPWIAKLPGYNFVASPAGHSKDRIAQLFQALNDKASQNTGLDDAQLVAAVGDEEQFATAIALIARQLGYESRVAVGFILDQTTAGQTQSNSCVNQSCFAHNLTAWAEIRSAQGGWLAVDSVPQYQNPVSQDLEALLDPKNVTEVEAPRANEVPPVESSPQLQEQNPTQIEVDPAENQLQWILDLLAKLLFFLALSLLLLSPVIAIVSIKAIRSKLRKSNRSPRFRVLYGWTEYLDRMKDRGIQNLEFRTRREQAEFIGGAGSKKLAQLADLANYSDAGLVDEQADSYWQLLELELAESAKLLSLGQRIRAKLSLSSLLPKRLASSRAVEDYSLSSGEVLDLELAGTENPDRMKIRYLVGEGKK